MTHSWTLECSHCGNTASAAGLPTVCPKCNEPWLVRYASAPSPSAKAGLLGRPWTMWRYQEWMPIQPGEEPVTLGEGMTPLIPWPALEKTAGARTVWIKDEDHVDDALARLQRFRENPDAPEFRSSTSRPAIELIATSTSPSLS